MDFILKWRRNVSEIWSLDSPLGFKITGTVRGKGYTSKLIEVIRSTLKTIPKLYLARFKKWLMNRSAFHNCLGFIKTGSDYFPWKMNFSRIVCSSWKNIFIFNIICCLLYTFCSKCLIMAILLTVIQIIDRIR